MEPVAFDRNHYCIDLTFYYRILADAIIGSTRPTTLYGLAVFSKRAVLCGEDSRAHIYHSRTRLGAYDAPSTLFANLPTAVVEVTAHNSLGKIDSYPKKCIHMRKENSSRMDAFSISKNC